MLESLFIFVFGGGIYQYLFSMFVFLCLIVYVGALVILLVCNMSKSPQERRWIPKKELDDFLNGKELRFGPSSFREDFFLIVMKDFTIYAKIEYSEGIRWTWVFYPFLPQFYIRKFGFISPFSKWTRKIRKIEREGRKKFINTLYDLEKSMKPIQKKEIWK